MKIVLRKSDWIDGWYVIERAEHDGSTWIEPRNGVLSFQCSSRISDADVEGDAKQMRNIVRVIRERGEAHHARCSTGIRRYFDRYKPRANGEAMYDEVTITTPARPVQPTDTTSPPKPYDAPRIVYWTVGLLCGFGICMILVQLGVIV
jgi:hypothetical protein